MNLVAVPLNVALPPPEPDEEDKVLGKKISKAITQIESKKNVNL